MQNLHKIVQYFDLYLKEMVWNIMNNVDLETAKKVVMDERTPFLEISGIVQVKIYQNLG